MAFQATVCNVMIASPGDIQIERNLVRETVHEWNSVNAITRNVVLLPVSWETHSTPLQGDRPQAIINKQVLHDSDLLVAAFWTRLGTPTGVTTSGTVEEITEHRKAGRPALLYFSTAPVELDSVDHGQYKALKEFKDECKKLGLYQTYDSPSDFKDKFRSHLYLTINTHPYFKDIFYAGVNQASGQPELSGSSLPSLTPEAAELLLAAASSGNGLVVHVTSLSGVDLIANGRSFIERSNPRSRAIWEGAMNELVRLGYLQSGGGAGLRLSREGYAAAELLKP